jgi:chromate transporter
MAEEIEQKPADRPDGARGSAFDVLMSFLKVGGSAFGGSTQAMVFREVVDRRQWMNEEQFIIGQAIAQVLPGANPVNLALYMGLKVAGGLGAAAAVFGMVIPAFCIIMAMGFAYQELSSLPVTSFVLHGVAAAGVGATVSQGLKTTRKLPKRASTFIVGAAVFITIGLLRWPMIPVVLVAVPVSIAWAYVEARRAA